MMNIQTYPLQLYQFCEMSNVEMRPRYFVLVAHSLLSLFL